LLNQRWNYTTSPTGTAGVDYVAIAAGGFYQRADITTASNGTTGTFAMAESSGIITITYTPAALENIYLSLAYSYKNG
jgi:hypothetical protein